MSVEPATMRTVVKQGCLRFFNALLMKRLQREANDYRLNYLENQILRWVSRVTSVRHQKRTSKKQRSFGERGKWVHHSPKPHVAQ
jgi:hypothetical protein